MTDSMLYPAASTISRQSYSGADIPLKSIFGARQIAKAILRGELPARQQEFRAVIAPRRQGCVTFKVAATQASATRRLLRRATQPTTRHSHKRESTTNFVSSSDTVLVEVVGTTPNVSKRYKLQPGHLVMLHIQEVARGYRLHFAQHRA